MKLSIGSDHAGYDLKKEIISFLQSKGHEVIDYGVKSPDSVDYPDFAIAVSDSVATKNSEFGILICGTGTGMAITANKVRGIRAANCLTPEMAELARQHNNANVLCMGARLINSENAMEITEKFIATNFEAGRHELRVLKIHSLTGL
ncbi:MAG: ribose 5-phosphate isomerase B [Candidatus Kapabacteria bacterium]|nr:ribose 5-phosphate isomerase B [Candidatus Kapabacteria bacterium]